LGLIVFAAGSQGETEIVLATRDAVGERGVATASLTPIALHHVDVHAVDRAFATDEYSVEIGETSFVSA